MLLNPANADLFQRYRDVKLALARREWDDGLGYARCKDGVVAEILRRGGWTNEEIREKEGLVQFEDDEEEEEVY